MTLLITIIIMIIIIIIMMIFLIITIILFNFEKKNTYITYTNILSKN